MGKISETGISRVCHPVTMLALVQYLLCSTMEEIESTHFIFTNSISADIRRSFKHRTEIILSHSSVFRKSFQVVRYLFWKAFNHLKWPFLANAKIFSQDHDWASGIFLWNHKYTLLEDGFCNYFPIAYKMQLSEFDLARKILMLLFFRSDGKRFGTPPNCECVLLSQPVSFDNPLREKIRGRIDLVKLWDSSSDEKRELIMRVFGLPTDYFDQFSGFDTLLLTQGLSERYGISEGEKIETYRRMLKHYGYKKCLIKPHPVEKTNYEDAFSNCMQIREKFPVELLAFAVPTLKKVITVNTTGSFSFKGKCEICWAGVRFCPELQGTYDLWNDIPEFLKGGAHT